MRITKISMCAAALSAAMLVGCSSSGGGSAAQQNDMSAGPTASEAGANIAVQAAAQEGMKKGGLGGSIGYGLQSQGSNLSRALFGKKKAAPPQQPTANGTSSSAASSSGTISTKYRASSRTAGEIDRRRGA
jgi:hypothetical protein